jgi:hypothetical protein
MRTTININERLLRNAKLRAAETHRTLTSVIEDALRLALEAKHAPVPNRRVSVPVSGAGGLLPGVDLDDNASVLDRMEGRT